MKILYDYQSFHYMRHGGISRYTYELIKHALSCKELEVYLFAGIFWTAAEIEQFKNDCSDYYGFRRSSFLSPSKFLGIMNRLLFANYHHRKTFDIYHPTMFLNLYPDFKGKRILTVHDLIGSYYPEDAAGTISTRLTQIGSTKASKILATSEHTKLDLMNILKVPEEKIKVTYLANPLTVEVKEERIIKEDYLLHVSGPGIHKNFIALLKAYSNSKFLRFNFKIVKFGINKLNEAEKDIVKRNKLENKIVVLLGSDQILANLYKYASVFVFPSLYEGFGIPPLEAMHYGCPVVVSNRSSIPEIVGDAGLYFDPENQEEIIEKCETLLSNSDLREKFISKGYLQEKKYSWEKCFDETLSVYKE